MKQEETDKDQKEIELRNANRQLDQMDGTKAIQDEKEYLNKLNTKASEYKEKLKSLELLSKKIKDYTAKMAMENELPDLMDPDVLSMDKNKKLDEFRNKVERLLDELHEEAYKLKESLKDVEQEIANYDEIIKACDKNLPDYSRVSNQRSLIREINSKFKELNIDSEARFSSSFVIELKNEEWRNSIETFLGIHRYSILVEPEYFHIANKVIDNSQYKYVELVNTQLLSKKEFEVVDDSLLYQLEIRNETAKKYFAYWLGRIHAVELSNVANYENAISKEGKISRNMAVSFLNFKKLDSYCLGEDAIKLNKEKAIREKNKLDSEKIALQGKIDENTYKVEITKEVYQTVNKEYDLQAPKNYSLNQQEIYECKDRIAKLEDALKHNNEYLLLAERISDIESKLHILKENIDRNTQEKMRLESNNASLFTENSELGNKKIELEAKLNELTTSNANEVKEAKDEYDQFVEGKKEYGDVLIPTSRQRVESEKRSCENSITSKQSVYNVGKHTEEVLPVGIEYESIYRKRKNRLQVDNFEEIKAKLADQTRKYEGIFKNEFVLKIKTNIEEAQSDIKEINKQLKKLQFTTTYQFDVKNVTGTSDYARIIEYADYLKKTNRIDDGQMMIGAISGYDENEAIKCEDEIKEIVNRIISKNNDDLLNDFADYRNYMEYEVIVNNDEITNGRLSKLAGYNSGAGTQIPYTIILSAALAIIYNARQNSTRLMFIDEPFEKMSDKNIKIMLDFFKSQEFQVIFCAPPNKLDSIGKECDAIIPIKKINKSNMTLGAFKFYEQV